VNFVELLHAPRRLRALGRLPVGLLVFLLLLITSVMTLADGPIASSSFLGAENPLSENGTWVTITAYSPYGTQFQKNNGAFADRLSPLNHAVSRTTAIVPADHYSEVVVGHIENDRNNVGPIARVQTSGAASDSCYLWWASVSGGANYLYRLDSNVPDPTRGTTYTATSLTPTSPVVDGDRLRLITRGQVIYGLKNGVRDFIYNTGTNTTKYSSGTTGIMAYADGAITNAVIASWSTGAAPISSGTWTSSNFAGTENPLDEGDRWYPLPGYAGFSKTGGQAIGLGSSHNASGVWSITPPASQYSEVTLGAVASGGGGPIVRIDRNNPGQTGWLLFLYADNPSSSGIYKMTPDANFIGVQLFTPTIVAGDKWRLTANGNTLNVYRNGALQMTYTTDGSYASGDVGIEAYTPAFTFVGWNGGDIAGPPLPAPTVSGVLPTNGLTTGGTAVTITGTNFVAGATVTLGGSAATGVTVVNSTTITATTPAHAAGAVSVTVTNPDTQSATLTAAFTYVLPPPTVASVTPVSGSTTGGTAITISGTNFVTGAGVTVGGSAATGVIVVNATTITAATPVGTAGTVNLTVTNPDEQTATLSNAFTYSATAPTVSSVSPNTGSTAGGTAITISGANFVAGATATVGGSAATGVTVVNNTTITATTPAHAAGPASVVVTNPDTQSATLTNGFTYLLPPPTVGSVTPVSGFTTGGTAITISGANFVAGATVTLGGSAATGVTVVNSTTITATTPAHAAGPASVVVTNPDTQSATLTNGFTYLLPPPTVSSSSPNSGLTTGGTAITISGANFVAGATVTLGGSAASGVTVVNSTTITATTPAHAAGAVSVTVTNPDTQSGTLASGFTYTAVPKPTLASITPNSGLRGTAVPVTLTGTNFTPTGTSVTVSGTGITVSNLIVVNDTIITATFTISASATISARTVSVTTSSGTSNTQAFTVLGPVLTSIAPSTGARGTTVPVTLTGAGLTGATAVTVSGSGITVSNFVAVNDTTVTATFAITAGAGLTARTVRVNTAVSGSSNTVTFTVVLPPVPTLTSISPNSGGRGTAVAVTLTGTDFTATGTRVSVSGTGIAVSNLTVVNDSTISATFTISATAVTGARTVSVTTPGGTSNTLTFTVL
jgi:IPT/TIG domain-containing protein